jgi:hypothetical protein
MTGQQLLQELRISLEQNLTNMPPEHSERDSIERGLTDRSLWSARRRRIG